MGAAVGLLALGLSIESPAELHTLTFSPRMHSSSRILSGAFILIADFCPVSTLLPAISASNIRLFQLEKGV